MIKYILKRIENKRSSKKVSWRLLVIIKDFSWVTIVKCERKKRHVYQYFQEFVFGQNIKTNDGWGLYTDEIKYIKSRLKKTDIFFEWGSGVSTKRFSPLVKKYYSIEHEKKYYDAIKNKTKANISYVPANKEDYRGDGDNISFKNYVNAIKKTERKYDFILIDGFARVHCAKAALRYLKKRGLLFIHDYDYSEERIEYTKVLKYYDLLEVVNTLGVFIKK